jgi:uncharacterized protein (DUF1499 family)
VWSWNRPDNLGLSNGRLAPCKRTPNCVSSQADSGDAVHYVTPIVYRGGSNAALAALREAIRAMPRARIVRETSEYLYAEFRSRLMRYVDDVEFAIDRAAGVIHVRSASRLGRHDFGVNRARVEAIRRLIDEQSA